VCPSLVAKGNLPRDVKTTRLLRWASHLDHVLEPSDPDETQPREDAEAGAPTSAGAPAQAPPTWPQVPSAASGKVSPKVAALREACGALASELQTELQAELDHGTALERAKLRQAAGAQAASAASAPSVPAAAAAGSGVSPRAAKRPSLRGKELAKRLATGWALGGVCTAWIFSGNVGHAAGLYLLAIVAQVGLAAVAPPLRRRADRRAPRALVASAALSLARNPSP
jgi:hypothetical protein